MDLFKPYVKFIDIYNPHEIPIQLNSVTYQVLNNDPYQLTDISKRSKLFKNISTQQEAINVTLKSKRHYIIPIEFGFEFGFIGNGETTFTSDLSFDQLNKTSIYLPKEFDVNKLEKKLEKISILSKLYNFNMNSQDTINYNKEITQKVEISNAFLKNTKNDITDIDIPHRFSIGSVINVKSLIVDQRNIFTPEPSDEVSSIIGKVAGAGSCPYLLVYDSKKGYWLNLGTVLVNRNNKNLQDTEIHAIGDSIIKIKLEERENEISYIDSIAILYTEKTTGVQKEIIPDISSITQVDGQYLVLNKGEKIEIDFNHLIPKDAKGFKVKVNGYYQRI